MPQRDAVGDRGGARGSVEAEGEARLVARVVVGGVDEVLHVRLAGGRGPVLVDEQREGRRVVAHLGGHRGEVRYADEEALALAQPPARRDDELLAVATPLRGRAVDRHAADALTGKVEVEA
jgi:hypothetical protein